MSGRATRDESPRERARGVGAGVASHDTTIGPREVGASRPDPSCFAAPAIASPIPAELRFALVNWLRPDPFFSLQSERRAVIPSLRSGQALSEARGTRA